MTKLTLVYIQTLAVAALAVLAALTPFGAAFALLWAITH